MPTPLHLQNLPHTHTPIHTPHTFMHTPFTQAHTHAYTIHTHTYTVHQTLPPQPSCSGTFSVSVSPQGSSWPSFGQRDTAAFLRRGAEANANWCCGTTEEWEEIRDWCDRTEAGPPFAQKYCPAPCFLPLSAADRNTAGQLHCFKAAQTGIKQNMALFASLLDRRGISVFRRPCVWQWKREVLADLFNTEATKTFRKKNTSWQWELIKKHRHTHLHTHACVHTLSHTHRHFIIKYSLCLMLGNWHHFFNP